MKKTFLKLFVALMALVILCTQLPLGIFVGAVDMTPTEYPENTVAKLSADLEYTGMIPNAAQTETEFESPIDLTSDDIDYFEFDLQVAPSAAFSGTVEVALYDGFGGYATYEVSAEINKWQHVKISPDDFVIDGIDMQNVIGYRINNPESWVKYTFVNLCLTGIMRPTDIPQGNVDYLVERLDFVDDKTNSSSSDIFSFDEIEQVDFLDKDWLEFDVFIVDGTNESVATNIGLTFTDINFDEATSKFGRNTLYLSNITVTTNKWNHIKIPTNNFKVGMGCETDKIVAVRVTSMIDNYRYVLGNIILKTAVVDAPAIPEDAVKISEGELIQYYSLTDDSVTQNYDFSEPVNVSGNDHIVIDIYADSAVEGIQDVELNLVDTAGKTATAVIYVNPGEWVNAKTLVDAFNAEDGFDFANVKSINLSNLVRTTRYFEANFYMTDAVFTISEEYPYNAIEKFDNASMDFFADKDIDTTAESYIDLGATYDLDDYDYVEFDLYVDTPVNSAELPTTFELNLVDTSGKKVLGRDDYTYNNVQHFRFLISALITGDGNDGNKSSISGISIQNAFDDSRYIIKNFCFTKIIAPEAPTKDVLQPLVAFSDVTPKYQHFYDNDVVFDGLVDDKTYDTTLDYYDATVGEEPDDEYLQFDIYVVLDKTSKYYVEELTASMKICDRPNYERHASENGRAHANFTVKTNEWVRVRIALTSFGTQPGAVPCDFNKIARFFIEGNAAGTRYIVANMCIGLRQSLPVEEDKPSMPDKNAMYVTDCDSANSSQNGVWSSSNTEFTTDYKTEGKGSALLKVTNQETDAMNSHRFLFSSSVDLSESKNIKFDLFVDDMELAAKCDYRVYISSDRRNTTDNFIYDIDASQLKLGWTSFDIPLSEFRENEDESADWSNIQCIAVEVIMNEEFESYGSMQQYFIFCLDNLRISDSYKFNQTNTGNTDTAPTDPDDEWEPSGQPGTKTVDTYTTITKDAEIITLDPEENTTYITQRVIKKQKVVLDTIAQSHWIVLIVTCIVAVILIAGSILLVVFTSKKRKLGGAKK